MGILWTVWPLDEEMRQWLDAQQISYPETSSCFPTGGEIRRVLADLPGELKINDNGPGAPFSVVIFQNADSWTSLHVDCFTSDAEPQKLWFEKGSERLIKEILGRLAVHCGPLALMADVGGDPQVILSVGT